MGGGAARRLLPAASGALEGSTSGGGGNSGGNSDGNSGGNSGGSPVIIPVKSFPFNHSANTTTTGAAS